MYYNNYVQVSSRQKYFFELRCTQTHTHTDRNTETHQNTQKETHAEFLSKLSNLFYSGETFINFYQISETLTNLFKS